MKKLLTKILIAIPLAFLIFIIFFFIYNKTKNDSNFIQSGSIEIKPPKGENNIVFVKTKSDSNFFKDFPKAFTKISGLKEVKFTNNDEFEIPPVEFLEIYNNKFPIEVKKIFRESKFYIYNKAPNNLPSEAILINLDKG